MKSNAIGHSQYRAGKVLRYSGNPKIRAAQRAADRSLLAMVKRDMRRGNQYGFRAWDSLILTMRTFNALDRLQARGLIRYSRKDHGYVATAKGMRSR